MYPCPIDIGATVVRVQSQQVTNPNTSYFQLLDTFSIIAPADTISTQQSERVNAIEAQVTKYLTTLYTSAYYRSLLLRDEPGYGLMLDDESPTAPYNQLWSDAAAAWNSANPNPSTHYIYNLIGGLEGGFTGYYANNGNLSYLTMYLYNLSLDPTGIFQNELNQIFANYPDFKQKLLNFNVFAIPNTKRGMADLHDPLSWAKYGIPGIYSNGAPDSGSIYIVKNEMASGYTFPYPGQAIDPNFYPGSGYHQGTPILPNGTAYEQWLDNNNMPVGYYNGNNSESGVYYTDNGKA